MTTPAIKILKAVALSEKRAIIDPVVIDRQFLVDMRRALLQQLAVVERKLNIKRHCNQCGSSDLSTS